MPVFELKPGSAIVQWRHGVPDAQDFPGEPRPMPDAVTYEFRNGWVGTGDLPCREALRALLSHRSVEMPTGPYPFVYVGNEQSPVDFSQFCHRPTLIKYPFQTTIEIREPGVARFQLKTAGGVHIWLDGKEIVAFEPFERNAIQATTFTVPLKPGTFDLIVLLEDLHERDTTCCFQLRWLEGPGAAIDIGIDDQDVQDAVDALGHLVTDKVFYSEGPVALTTSSPPRRPMLLTVENIAPFPRGGLVNEPGAGLTKEINITNVQPKAEILDTAEMPAGCLSLDVSTLVNGVTVRRRLGVTILPRALKLSGNIEDRKRQAAHQIEVEAGFDPSVATLLALRGVKPERVAEVLKAALPTIENRYDCADFSILPLLRLWRDARATLDHQLADRLKAAILGFRYWMSEPGNDVMWFWSENHVLCFHAAQAIAGGLFPDEVFSNSGMTGTELRADVLPRLERWFDSIDDHGLCEWNSAAYYPIDLLALISLHDLEPAFKARAAVTLDRLFLMVALHTSGGVPAGAQGRCYEKELLAGPMTELGSVAAIAFGGNYWAGYDRAAALLCVSDYVPPQDLERLAWPENGRVLGARYTQGLNNAGKLSLWKSPDGQLSTATGHDPDREGHQAHVLDVQMVSHPMARLWINHPGDSTPWGERRPSLLAGNHVMPAVAQIESLALVLYDLDRPWTDIDEAQLFAFSDAFDRYDDLGDWKIFHAGSGCVGVWCSDRLRDVGGLYAGSLWRASGRYVGWVVAMSHPDEDDTAFEKRVRALVPRVENAAITCRTPEGGVLKLCANGDLVLDGESIEFTDLSTVPNVQWM